MFKFLHNGTYHTDTSTEYLENLGLDESAIESVLNQKAFEEAQKAEITSANNKRIGAVINGEQISLNENNQNGIAAVLTGLHLAEEMEYDIFPIAFNAETATGSVSIPFDSLASFKAFSLQFIGARQAFFN
jgi:hypothetical protein